MSLDQKRARWFGVLYLVTFVTSIPALLLYQPVLDDPAGYITGGRGGGRCVGGHGGVHALGDQGLDVPPRPPVGWVVGWGNGLILGYMIYRTGLVPRAWTWLGLVGGPLIIIAGTIVLLGGNPATSALKGPASIPEAAWELFLGIDCTIWGFRADAPILSDRASASAGSAPIPAV